VACCHEQTYKLPHAAAETRPLRSMKARRVTSSLAVISRRKLATVDFPYFTAQVAPTTPSQPAARRSANRALRPHRAVPAGSLAAIKQGATPGDAPGGAPICPERVRLWVRVGRQGSAPAAQPTLPSHAPPRSAPSVGGKRRGWRQWLHSHQWLYMAIAARWKRRPYHLETFPWIAARQVLPDPTRT
jgi:hypothetical protein